MICPPDQREGSAVASGWSRASALLHPKAGPLRQAQGRLSTPVGMTGFLRQLQILPLVGMTKSIFDVRGPVAASYSRTLFNAAYNFPREGPALATEVSCAPSARFLSRQPRRVLMRSLAESALHPRRQPHRTLAIPVAQFIGRRERLLPFAVLFTIQQTHLPLATLKRRSLNPQQPDFGSAFPVAAKQRS